MQFSPELEAKFADLVTHYPAGRQRAALIPMLLYAQDETGAVTPEMIAEIAGRLGLTRLQVEEVVSYYTMFHREPLGKHHIQVCTNISCLLLGAGDLLEHACRKLGVPDGGVTPDGQFSVQHVECMGACSWAPAIQVNYDYHHHVDAARIDQLIDQLRKVQ
jgi:NADH-quinone oxidoreductase subunit E